MASTPPNSADNIDPSAKDATRTYARDFANELLTKAQVLALEKREQASQVHVHAAWQGIQRERKRPFWKELLLGVGWACIGAFFPAFVESLSTGSVPTAYVVIGLLGVLLVIWALARR
jgi:hypothetical protein